MIGQSNENYKRDRAETASEVVEVDKNREKEGRLQEVRGLMQRLSQDLEQDTWTMELDIDEVRFRHSDIMSRIQNLGDYESEETRDAAAELNDTDTAFHVYESRRKDFESCRNAAVNYVRTRLYEAADAARSAVRALENLGTVGDQAIESKRGIVGLADLSEELSERTRPQELAGQLDSIRLGSLINSGVSVDSATPAERQDLVSAVNRVERSLKDLEESLTGATRMFVPIQVKGYEEVSEKFGSLSRGIEDTLNDLSTVRRKLENQ